MRTRVDRLKDCLHFSLGPFGQQLPVEPMGKVVQHWLQTLTPSLRYLKDYLTYGRKKVDGEIRGAIWLMVGSKNNLDTLAFLAKDLPNSQIVVTNKKVLQLGYFPRLLFHQALWSGYQFWPSLFGLYPAFKSKLLRNPQVLADAIGVYEASLDILKDLKPEAIVFTNDHFYKMRALMWAAKTLEIPTIYIQHASINEYFPPLKYDLALLEGRDTVEKYQAIGPIDGKVQLIGMPKFDAYVPFRNQRTDIKEIGVCTSIFDEAPIILELLKFLAAQFPQLNLTYRKHPRDERPIDLPPFVHQSNPNQETIFEFLKSKDILIAGDTSTHLEAALLNIPSLYYRMHDHFYDYYKYLKNGLVEEAKELNDLTNLIEQILYKKPDVLSKAKFYNEVVGTDQDGHSKVLAVACINAFLKDKKGI